MSKRVIVGMSGGVDSSYAAYLLTQQGYEVIGVMLNLWNLPAEKTANRCCSDDSQRLARRTAAQLKIPFYMVDESQHFYEEVVNPFITDYMEAKTPNPCMRCNPVIRWRAFLRLADEFGAEYIATGHYARLIHVDGSGIELWKAKDTTKDQSYVLSRLTQEQLIRTILPLGDLLKTEVRAGCKSAGLPVHSRKDSQDLCFVGEGGYRTFLKQMSTGGDHPGKIVEKNGKVLGTHDGLENYTIGQRQKMRIANTTPLYIIKKDLNTNQLIVGTKQDRYSDHLFITQPSWVSGQPPSCGKEYEVKIRYHSETITCAVEETKVDSLSLRLLQPAADITPGQYAVLYNGENCLGAGIIV